MRALSIAKIDEGLVNEDAAIAKEELIAVSDGAGGGGVFAECWSKYLVEHLPDKPIKNYKTFDKWIEGIWEPFYNECEEKAKSVGGMFLNKFYDEGSFATLVAAWNTGQWISYGDSVAFSYDRKSGRLQHSFGHLADFDCPPYLINCKDPLNEKGFKSGQFVIHSDSIVFAASDALAHYILMMYEVTHKEEFTNELREAIQAQTKNSNFIKTALSQRNNDFEGVIKKLPMCKNLGNYKKHLASLRKKGLIGHDDYSIVIM